MAPATPINWGSFDGSTSHLTCNVGHDDVLHYPGVLYINCYGFRFKNRCFPPLLLASDAKEVRDVRTGRMHGTIVGSGFNNDGIEDDTVRPIHFFLTRAVTVLLFGV